MQINQITKVRTRTGEEIAIVDWTWHPLYSSAYILDGATDQIIRLFTYAEGDIARVSDNLAAASRPTATDFDTNISEASEMDSTEELLCYAIQVEILQFVHVAPAINIDGALTTGIPRAGLVGPLMARMILELEVSQKSYPKAGLGYFTTGFGPTVFANNIAAAATFANSGVQSREAVDQFPVPVHLGGTEKYSVLLKNPTGTALDFRDDAGDADDDAVAFLRCYLVGLHKRPTG